MRIYVIDSLGRPVKFQRYRLVYDFDTLLNVI